MKNTAPQRNVLFLIVAGALIVLTSVFLWSAMKKAQEAGKDYALIKFYEENADTIPSVEFVEMMKEIDVIVGPELLALLEQQPIPPVSTEAEKDQRWERYRALSQEDKLRLKEAFITYRDMTKAEQERVRLNLIRFHQLSSEDRQKIEDKFKTWSELPEEEKAKAREEFKKTLAQ